MDHNAVVLFTIDRLARSPQFAIFVVNTCLLVSQLFLIPIEETGFKSAILEPRLFASFILICID